jgi:hypothetical protein
MHNVAGKNPEVIMKIPGGFLKFAGTKMHAQKCHFIGLQKVSGDMKVEDDFQQVIVLADPQFFKDLARSTPQPLDLWKATESTLKAVLGSPRVDQTDAGGEEDEEENEEEERPEPSRRQPRRSNADTVKSYADDSDGEEEGGEDQEEEEEDEGDSEEEDEPKPKKARKPAAKVRASARSAACAL